MSAVAWQILAMVVRRAILPTPLVVLSVFWTALPGKLGGHFLASLYRVVASIVISVVLAAPAGLALGQSRRLNRFFSPLIYLLYPVPKVVFVPIVLLFFGVGDGAKILLISTILFFQILVLVRDSAAALRPELLLSVRSLGAGRRALFRFIYLPASLPAVSRPCGSRLAQPWRFSMSQSFCHRKGLGYFIFSPAARSLTTRDVRRILAMSLLGLGLYFGVDLAQKRLCRGLRILMAADRRSGMKFNDLHGIC
jgi:NitT/TauT family transport system permease protein